MVFHPVGAGSFSGGYYLGGRLPWLAGDLFFHDPQEELWVLMSGSIYNRHELFTLCSLSAPVPDAELAGRLFTREGPDFVRRLNGDFAIFIWRQSTGRAWIFRDHVGIRPFAWAADDRALFFSTDVQGLCRALGGEDEVDSTFLSGYFRYIDYRRTPCSRVHKALPGHYTEFFAGSVRTTKYWTPEKIREEKGLTHGQMLEELGTIVRDSVRIRCDDRFRAGAHVSGGLDSGFVAALARKEYSHQEDFPGYSWTPADCAAAGDMAGDERELVLRTCETAGIRPLFSVMNREDFRRIIESSYDYQGVFAERRTTEQASAEGTNLIFSGWGGDEFISTGAAAIEADLLRKLRLRLFFRRNPVIPFRRFVKRVLYCVVLPALHIPDRATAQGFSDDSRYLKKPFRKNDRKAVRDFHYNISRRRYHLGMLDFYHLQQRCESWAVHGYRNGVEYRYPLLDRRIIEYMLKTPTKLLCVTDHFRPLLRELSEGILPEKVRWNYSKNDPVYHASIKKMTEEAAILYMDEAEAWRNNRDLHFIDFVRLRDDIARYRSKQPGTESPVLFRAIVYTKVINEFSRRYHDDTQP